MLAFSFMFLIGHLLIEMQVYLYSLKRLMRKEQDIGRGVFVNGKLYIYDDDMPTDIEAKPQIVNN